MAWVAPHLDATGYTVYSLPSAGASSGAGRIGALPTILYVSTTLGDNAYDGRWPTHTPGGTGLNGADKGPKKTLSNTRTFTVPLAAAAQPGAHYLDVNGGECIVLQPKVAGAGTTLFCSVTTGSFSFSGGTLNRYAGAGDNAVPYSGVSGLQSGAWSYLVQTGGFNQYTWVLCKKGDTFAAQAIEMWYKDDIAYISGFSVDEPILLSSYDPAFLDAPSGHAVPNPYGSSLPRPLFLIPSDTRHLSFLDTRSSGIGDKMHWYGLEAFCSDDSQQPIAQIESMPSVGIRYEDCYFHGFGQGINVPAQYQMRPEYLIFHRCTVADNHGTGIEGEACTLTECIIDHNNLAATVYIHNMYFGGRNAPHRMADWYGNNLTGCIVSNDAAGNNFRSGGILDNNAWLRNRNAIGAFGNIPFDGFIINNVFMDAMAYNIGSPDAIDIPFGFEGPYYQGDQYNLGNITINNNIFAHAIDATSAAIFLDASASGVTYSNNTVYNWNPWTPGQPAIVTGLPGGVRTGHISNPGSNYSPLTFDITSVGQNGQGIFILTVPTSTDRNPWHTGEGGGYAYLTGLPGIPELNNKTVRITTIGDPTIWEVNDIPYSGVTFNGHATAYAMRDCSFNTGSVNGAGCAAMAIVGPAGTVLYVSLSGVDGVVHGYVGHGYQIGEDLGSTTLNAPSGGAFTFRIDSLCTNTNGGGNLLTDAAVAAFQPDATKRNRHAGTYMDFLVGGTGHTAQDFILAARSRCNKTTWDPLFTAKSLNDYMREGMGKAMIGSAYASGTGSLILAPSSLPNGVIGTPYSQTITASGGTGPYTFTVISGAVPTGLNPLTSGGLLSGTPTVAGSFSFTVRATDSLAAIGTAFYIITIPGSAAQQYHRITLTVTAA